jgi:hypothetical protein
MTIDELMQIRARHERIEVLKNKEPQLVLGPMDGDFAHADRGMLLSQVSALVDELLRSAAIKETAK